MVSLKTNYIDDMLEDGLTETRRMTMASFKTVLHSQLHQRRVRRLGLTETRQMTMASFKTVPHSQLHQRRVRRLGLTETRWMTTASFKTVPRSQPQKFTKDVSEGGVRLVLAAGPLVLGAGGGLGRCPRGAPPPHAAADDRQHDHLHHLRHRQDAGSQEKAHVTAHVA